MKKIFLLVVLLIGAVGDVRAINPVPYTESLGFSFKISGNTGGSGTSHMTIFDEEGMQRELTTWVSGDPVESGLGLAKLRPGKTYELNFWGSGPTAYWMSFDAPVGYQVYVDGVATDLVARTTSGGWYLHYYTVELRPIGSSGGGAWGSFSGIKIGQSITWEVGLGDLRTGRGAGTIVFKEADLGNSAASRDRLYYNAPPSNVGQIVVVRDGASNQRLQQIVTPIGFTDIVDEVAGGYTIKFYFWSDVTDWDGTKYSFGGTPWKTIRVESAGANQLKITESEGASSPVVRVHELNGAATAASTTATGGTITDNLTSRSNYRIHTFTSGGTFAPSVNLSSVDYLVVGGGGGAGGGGAGSGGGGAGGVLSGTLSLAAGSYSVTVGSGGAGGGGAGANGGASVFYSITAMGGGGGGSYGSNGGSGGGGADAGRGYYPGTGIGGQGYDGGYGYSDQATYSNFGGGGGAGAAGGNATYNSHAGDGGAGVSSSITGSTVSYGGGGGAAGQSATQGSGGTGGGGAGANGNGGAGTANTGGGGGGSLYGAGGAGGSGVVIIRYPLVGSGSYTWTLQEGDGTTVLRTTEHTITYPAGNERDDVVEVFTGGTSGAVVAKTKYHYVDHAWGEELVSVTADPDAANPAERTTSYEYYTNSADRGDYRRIKSVTEPTGNWVAYDYYDDWERRGRVFLQFQPWLDTPATASVTATTGRVLYFYYSLDWSGRYSRPSVRIERINSAVTGYVDWTYGDTTVGGQPIVYATMRSYRNSTEYHSDYTASYRADADPDLAGLPYVAKPANLTQTSVSISRGTFNDTTKVFTVGSSGDHWREVRFNGTTSTSGTDAVTSFNGQSCESIRMVPNKSTATVTIRIAQGFIYRTETWVWTGATNGFQLMTWENFTWDAVGQLRQRWLSNGALTYYQYTKGRMDLTSDATGAHTAYAYDELGRVKWSRRNGVTASGFTLPGDIYTHYVYDGADRVVKTVVTASSTVPSPSGTTEYLESTTKIDLAGRVTQMVAPGGYTTGYGYTSNGKIVTAILPGGGTKITEVYLDGQLKSQTGSAQVGQFFTPRIDSSGYRVVDNYLGSSGSAAWRGLLYDWNGRLYQDWRWGGNGSYYSEFYVYNGKAQLDYIWHNDGKANYCYEYDILGAIRAEGDDLNGNSLLDRGSDRITEYNSYYFNYAGGWWFEKTTSVYATAGSSTATQLSKQNWQLSNLPTDIFSVSYSYDIFGNATVTAQHVDRSHAKVTVTANTPDSTIDAEQVSYNGLLVSAKDTVGITMKYGYDALGRQNTTIDPRTGTTTTVYKSGTSQVHTVTDPASVVQATYAYDSAGRVQSIKNALNKYVYYAYDTLGQKTREWGDTTYPAEYIYDTLGRVYQQKTYAQSTATFTGSSWPSSPNNAQTTTWNYDAASGVLTSKTDAAGKSVSYTYTGAGQLATREWARLKTGTSDRVKATYTYSTTTRELTGVSYNDGTPSLAYTYNRLGQTATVNDGGIGYTRTFNYNLGGTLELQNEELGAGSGDFYDNRVLTYGYDTTTGFKGRPTALKLGSSSHDDLYQSVAYVYDYAGAGRFKSVAAAGQTFSYTYTANSHLIEEIKNSTTPAYSDKRTYDPKHDWVEERETKWGSGGTATRAKFAYAQDNLGRVTNVTKAGTLYDFYGPGSSTPYGLKTSYGYNDRSELTSENTTDLAASPVDVTGRQTSYGYDQLGNRTSVTKARGSGNAGGNLSFDYNPASYEINSLNQYRRRTVPGVYDVALMSSATSVTVDGGGMVKQGLYFFRGHPLNNSSGPVFDSLTITPSSGTGGTTDAYLPHTNEDFTYDDDGNLTRDGRWVYQYDAENRLVAMFTCGAPEDANKTAAANVAVWGSGLLQQKLLFTYDYLGRRVQKVTYYWTGSAWALDDQTKFVYNGWNCIATLNAASGNAVIADYYWGLDLSGTSQGAGGIGGLLLVKEGSNAYLPVYDALGNVHAMLTAASVTLGGTSYAAGDIVAAYEYDAFGNTLRESGPYAASNPFRFGTKYTDLETGLLYYDTRYYSPSLGRFINRDTIGEQGGLNLYAYVSNRVPNAWDLLGRDAFMVQNIETGGWYEGDGPSGMDIVEAKNASMANVSFATYADQAMAGVFANVASYASDHGDFSYENMYYIWNGDAVPDRTVIVKEPDGAQSVYVIKGDQKISYTAENAVASVSGGDSLSIENAKGAVVYSYTSPVSSGLSMNSNAPNSGYGAPGAECSIVTVQTIQKLSGVPVDSRETIISNFGLPAANFEPGGDGLPSKPGAATDYLNKALNPSGLKVDRVDVGPGNFDFASLVAKGNLLILGAQVSNDRDAIRAGGPFTLNHLVAASPTGAANGSLTIYNPTGSGGKVTYTVAQAMVNQYPKNSEGLSGRVWYVYNTDD